MQLTKSREDNKSSHVISENELLELPISDLFGKWVLNTNILSWNSDSLIKSILEAQIQNWVDLFNLLNINVENPIRRLISDLSIDESLATTIVQLRQQLYIEYEFCRHNRLCVEPLEAIRDIDILDLSIEVLYDRGLLRPFKKWSIDVVKKLLYENDIHTWHALIAVSEENPTNDGMIQRFNINQTNARRIFSVANQLKRIVDLSHKDLQYPKNYSTEAVKAFLLEHVDILRKVVVMKNSWEATLAIWKELNWIADIFLNNDMSDSSQTVLMWIDQAIDSYMSLTITEQEELFEVLTHS